MLHLKTLCYEKFTEEAAHKLKKNTKAKVFLVKANIFFVYFTFINMIFMCKVLIKLVYRTCKKCKESQAHKAS